MNSGTHGQVRSKRPDFEVLESGCVPLWDFDHLMKNPTSQETYASAQSDVQLSECYVFEASRHNTPLPAKPRMVEVTLRREMGPYEAVSDILTATGISRNEGIGPCLVAAALQMRFNNPICVRHKAEAWRSADLGFDAQFEIAGNCVIVAVQPGQETYNLCDKSVRVGKCTHLVVPTHFTFEARPRIEELTHGRAGCGNFEAVISSLITHHSRLAAIDWRRGVEKWIDRSRRNLLADANCQLVVTYPRGGL